MGEAQLLKHVFRLALRSAVVAVIVGVTVFASPKVAWSEPETRSEKVDVDAGKEAKTSFPTTHLVVSWDGDTKAGVEVRGADDKGRWGGWEPVSGEREAPNERSQGMVLLKNAKKVQTRVVSGVATKLSAQAIDAENGPRKLKVIDTSKKAEAASVSQPDIISRGGWGANESLRSGAVSFANISKVVVHHTDTSNNDPNPAATVRAILSWHTQGNGWSDIGYNFLIDQQGRIYEGRASGSITGENAQRQGVIGAHAQGANTGSVGISMLGTFTNQAPTAAQQDALAHLIGWKASRHNLNPTAPGTVIGHREVNPTTCPGNAAMAVLPGIKANAATYTAASKLTFNPGNTPGYWVAAADGRVMNYGNAANKGSMAGKPLAGEITSMSRTATADGYWLMGSDGGIFSFGDARFYGSMGGKRLNQEVVGLAATPSGGGYWLVARDGGIFSFGDARFYGSMGGKKLNQPIVGMSPTPSGNGYWLVAADGGIFSFGDATFKGSAGSLRLAKPIVTMTPAANGGYWLMAEDGGVFSYGTGFFGSVPMLRASGFKGTEAAATKTGQGYYMLSENGGVYAFGDARFHGAPTGKVKAAAIVLTPAP